MELSFETKWFNEYIKPNSSEWKLINTLKLLISEKILSHVAYYIEFVII